MRKISPEIYSLPFFARYRSMKRVYYISGFSSGVIFSMNFSRGMAPSAPSSLDSTLIEFASTSFLPITKMYGTFLSLASLILFPRLSDDGSI